MDRRNFLSLAAAGAAGLIASPTEVLAQSRIQLSDGIKGRLKGLRAIRGSAVGDEVFGSKPLLVTFFASWCPPCRAEFVEIRRYLDAAGSDKLHVVAVNHIEDLVPRSAARFRRMLREIPASAYVVEGTPGIARDFGGVLSIPAAYIFDPTGREVFRLGGDRGSHGRQFLKGRQLARVIDGMS